MKRRWTWLVLIVWATFGSWGAPAAAQEGVERKVQKTDAEWARLLTREQFLVTRRKATEPAFSGKYAGGHPKGTFACVCCGAPLFDAKTKFESGTGWPSFFRPIDEKAVETAPDHDLGVARVEVLCRDCGAHLGHVFDDGPAPTGLRYCMNSAALKLLPAATAKAAPKPKASAPSLAEAKPKTSAPSLAEAKPKAVAVRPTGRSTAAAIINGSAPRDLPARP